MLRTIKLLIARQYVQDHTSLKTTILVAATRQVRYTLRVSLYQIYNFVLL